MAAEDPVEAAEAEDKAPPTALLGRADFSAGISVRLIRRKSIQILGSPKKRSFYGAAEAEDKICLALETLHWFLGPKGSKGSYNR